MAGLRDNPEFARNYTRQSGSERSERCLYTGEFSRVSWPDRVPAAQGLARVPEESGKSAHGPGKGENFRPKNIFYCYGFFSFINSDLK